VRLNVPRTHEGAPAVPLTPYGELRRSVLSCLLWEREFYCDGKDIAARIVALAEQVDVGQLASLAVEARNEQQLRHAPLLLLTVLARRGRGKSRLVAEAIRDTIKRADELGEFLAIYAQANGVDGQHVRKKLSAQVKKGLALAFANFDEYQLAKYDTRKGQVALRDVMRLAHPVPGDRKALHERLKRGELADPMTWERQLSAGGDKREVFTQLLQDQKLGYMALLRNLRNMGEAGVDDHLVEGAILARKGAWRVLPFRFVAAANHCPSRWLASLGFALREHLKLPGFVLPGMTGVLVDVSGSMVGTKLSGKSDMDRLDAAASLAALVPAERRRIWTFSADVREVIPMDNGKVNPLALIKVVRDSQEHGGTYLGAAVTKLNREKLDRLIVITDEQSHDTVGEPTARRAYMINVGSAQNGVGYGEKWVHIDGWSESVLRYIASLEGQVKALPPMEEVE
jgi:60 kDa SS-A/Ro ribonucleoprotein